MGKEYSSLVNREEFSSGSTCEFAKEKLKIKEQEEQSPKHKTFASVMITRGRYAYSPK